MKATTILGTGVLFALLASCAASPEETARDEQAATTQNEAAPPRFTYESLVTLIQSRGLTSVEAVLPELPAELRASYALVYQSKSLQGASHESPRVILFGADAQLTCAFNGDPAHAGFDSLECIQFRERERAFDFRHIRFPTPANRLDRVEFSDSNQTTDGSIRCSACHGSDPRPNWDDYDQWVGAYGADDDALGSDAPHYAEYVARRPDHARYRHLIQDATPTAPYTIGYSSTVARRPNVRLSDAVGRMNAFRTTRLLTRRVPEWQRLAFAVRALDCALSPEQTAALVGSGFDPVRELDLGRIFGVVGVPSREWGTAINPHPTGYAKPWEHQAGFSYLSIDIGMTIAQDHARAGNTVLQAGLDRIRAYYPTRYNGAQLAFFTTLNALVPDPDIFGGHVEENEAHVCPELVKLFVAEALAR